MATYDLTVGGSTGAAAHLSGRIFTQSIEIDFNETNRSATDVLNLFDIAAGSQVLFVAWEVLTAEGATLTFDIGDTSDPNGFISGANGNAIGRGANTLTMTEGAPNTVAAYSGGKFYTAAGTIDLVLGNNAANAKIKVSAVYLDLN